LLALEWVGPDVATYSASHGRVIHHLGKIGNSSRTNLAKDVP